MAKKNTPNPALVGSCVTVRQKSKDKAKQPEKKTDAR